MRASEDSARSCSCVNVCKTVYCVSGMCVSMLVR